MRFSLSILLLLFVGKLKAQTATEDTRGANPVATHSDEALGSEISYHALMFAVEDYDDPNIRDLEHPVADAKNLRDVIIDKYGFKPTNVRLLINPTESQIVRALDSAVNTFLGTENLLLFFAGHGTWNEILKEGYWLPSDAVQNNPSSSISNSTLISYVGGINTQHTLLISDACFSGGIILGRSVESTLPGMFVKRHSDRSRKAMTSGNKDEVPDESMFMYYLLKGLKQNSSKYLPANKLYSIIEEPVARNAIGKDGLGIRPIYAPMIGVGDENGEFIFTCTDSISQSDTGQNHSDSEESIYLDKQLNNSEELVSKISTGQQSKSIVHKSHSHQPKSTNNKVPKEVRKAAKKYENEGWSPFLGASSIDQQLQQSLKMQGEVDEMGFPIWIVSNGSSTASSLAAAEMQAIESAKSRLVSLIESNIVAVIQHSVDFNGDVNSTIEKTTNKVAKTLGDIFPVVKIQRKVNNHFEVQVAIAYGYEHVKEDVLKIR